MSNMSSRPIAAVFLTLFVSVAAARGDEPANLADYFGFLPVEVYKLDQRINNLTIKDLDGDKIDDITVVNNGRSRIELLLSTPGPNDFDKGITKETNEIVGDRRMRLKSISVNHEVVALGVGDFNGDGKIDLAYYGTPAELVILYNQGKGRFGDIKKIAAGEAISSNLCLAVGDFNQDHRDDLALLDSDEVVLIYQQADGKLADPERIPHTAPKPGSIKAVDLDGDRRDDMVIFTGEDDSPMRVRFGIPGGKLGPEQRMKTESHRAFAFGDIDGKPGSEMSVIEGQSGRVRVLALSPVEASETEGKGELLFYALPHGETRGRSLAIGDLDGDHRADVVVSDPSNAQFVVFRQAGAPGTPLDVGAKFPGLVGGNEIKLADTDGDGKVEVFVLSEQEKQIGKSVFKDNRLTFPSPLPLKGEPVMLEVADIDGDKIPEVLYITRDSEKKGSDAFKLHALKREASGSFVPFSWGKEPMLALPGVTGKPAGLRVLDVNQDGQADYLVFKSYGAPLLLVGRSGEAPKEVSNLGPLAKVDESGITVANFDGPALFVAQNNFARKLKLDASGTWEVQDQFNSGQTTAAIEAATAIDTDGDGVKEIVMLDRKTRSLIYLTKKDGAYRPSGTLSVGSFNFQGLHVADLDGDGKDDLLLAGSSKFGVVLTGRKGRRFKEIAGYEHERERARFADLVVGDLNGDGQSDLAILDVGDHFIEIATYLGQFEMKKAIAFRVFEQKSFHEFGETIEPRDINVGDVDGDGRTDLVLISHNRVLVYRQDPGTEKTAQAKP